MHLIDQQLNLMVRGRFEDAWKLSEKIQETEPDNLRHMFNRGWFFIHRGDFQTGFQLLEAGRHVKVYGGPFLTHKKPIWNNHDITDKTVVINGEGGFGDQMIFVRFAKEIMQRKGKCVVICDEVLKSLFARVPGVHEAINPSEIQSIEFDYWIPGFSTSWIFGHTKDTVPNEPYMFPNPLSVTNWKQIIKTDKLKVGIKWSGNPKYEHQQFRYFPPSSLINICDDERVQFYSLQRDNDLVELPEHIIDLQHLLISWEDTAACIANLDLVITSCTSIAHLASAMGKPTWIVVPILPYHIWAYGGKHSPWYQKSTQIFRQTKFGCWNKPFEDIKEKLKTLVD
jgi:hypothetical protein